MRQFLASILEVAEVAIVALLAVIFIRTFLVQPFLVSGASMVPTFINGDYLLIDELTYRFREPARGEVVVFRYPKDESTYFIKRIIGMPGDMIVIQNGQVKLVNSAYPDGKVFDEKYLPPGMITTTRSAATAEFKLHEEEYLVLGDNRPFSFDSRDWGILRAEEIVGLVRLRLWPVRQFMVFAAPNY